MKCPTCGDRIEEHQYGSSTDACVAQALGWRAWAETRGQTSTMMTMATLQRPDTVEPWLTYRSSEQEFHRKRFTEITCREAREMGMFGMGFPGFSRDIKVAWEQILMWSVTGGYHASVRGSRDMAGGGPETFWATIGTRSGTFEAMAGSAPLACCRVFLTAIAARSLRAKEPVTE